MFKARHKFTIFSFRLLIWFRFSAFVFGFVLSDKNIKNILSLESPKTDQIARQ